MVSVGMIGLGKMGMPMLERLRAASLRVRCCARRPEVAGRAAALGATIARSVAEAADGVDVVIVCVYSDEQVREVCLGPDGLIEAMATGSVLVDHTTGSPTTLELLDEAAGRRGVRVLDGALSGSPAQVAAGELTLLIGGEASVLEAARPALRCYGDPILHVGRLGDGQRIKLVNNALFGAQVAMVAAAERLASGLGVDPAAALAAIAQCSGDSRVLRYVVALGSSARLQEAAGRFIRKDVDAVEHVAGELGVDLGLLGVAARHAS